MDEGVPAVLRRLGALGLLLQLGWTMAAALVVSLLIGLWIDDALGTRPWATLVFTLLGIGAGTLGVYRIIARVLDEQRHH
jgi:F0F1-type ATP synthase assembly protein I